MQSNNKRIAKNTLFLYIRMLLIMAVTLYTSRVVLEALGVEDFGIYSVVGGVIVMFAFINSAMSVATQRFLTYEMGMGNTSKLKTVFCTSIIIHSIIAFIILILGETVGLWFLENKMSIPSNRMDAAFLVYQLSVVSCIVSIISLPYNAAIIAYEKMSVFAYISAFDAAGRLFTAYFLLMATGDKLIIYAMLICLVQVLIRLIYGWYCKKYFKEIKFAFLWNKEVFREMLSFSGWNVIGGFAYVLSVQGVDILLNIFFGPSINAAKGISNQVQMAVNSFCANFQTAVNPQITKCYAAGDIQYVNSLIFSSSRFSFYIMLLPSLPILLEANYILKLWLKTVPDYSMIFVQLSIIVSLLSVFANPLITGNFATGKIKKLLIAVGLINCGAVPLAYIFLKLGGLPWAALLAQIIIATIAFGVNLRITGKHLNFSVGTYFKQSLAQPIAVLVICLPLVYMVKWCMAESLLRLVFVTLASMVVVGLVVFTIGINRAEKNMARSFVANRVYKLRK
jgi:O-antigen/teichoic acid export membrane protein